MGVIEVAAAVAAIVLVVLACFMIPTFIEIRRTTVALRELITRTDGELKPLFAELHETLTNLKVLTGDIAASRNEIVSCMEAVGDTGRNISRINTAVSGVASIFSKYTLWATGARVAGRYLAEKFTRKEQGGDDHGK